MFKKIQLLATFILLSLSSTLWAEPAPMAESHLLLPFFEVSLKGIDQMTFFSIVNASDQDLDLTAKIYSNWAIPMLEIPFMVKAKEVKSINLHDWIVSGKLPLQAAVCGDGGADCMDLKHMRTALAGQPSAMTQLFYGTELEPGAATGFITIEADNGFLPESDVLWGDYFYTNPSDNFAQGQRLVRREPNLSCADLCLRHSIRFLEGGGFSGGTKLTIWNWDGVERQPSEFPAPQFELEKAQIDVYGQDGTLVDVIPQLQVLPVQTILVSDLNLDQNFGWLDLTTFEPSTIAGYYRAMGKFSVGVPAWCLPCDPCNANGPCFEPGNPECGPAPCIPVRLRFSGDARGIVGQPFNMAFSFSGSPEVLIEVSDLPDGLIQVGRTIQGIPSTSGSFTIEASNDCGLDNIRVEVDGPNVQPAFLTLVKEVINDNGGSAGVSDFPLYIDNQPVPSGFRSEVQPGTYNVREDNLSGYTAGPWTGDCSASGQVVLNPGDDKTCHITNDDDEGEAHLTLIKRVVNDNGGTAGVSDFQLFINGQQVSSGVRTRVTPGTFTASENNLPGYSAGSWQRDCATNGTVNLENGDDKTCMITNDDQESTITLIKFVSGGGAQVADFDLFAGSQQVTSGVPHAIQPGTYSASENNLPGYSAGPWGGDCAPDGSFTLALGEHKVCEITNFAEPARITLIKHVINDDGGTAIVSDFALSVGSQRVNSGVTTDMAPGAYIASEQNLPGYQAGSWTGDCSANGSVTLVAGEHKVCEITNDDQPSTITLIKHVVNDNGGTAQVSDFVLSIGGRQVASGVSTSLTPGAYAASEQNLPGYKAGAWGGDCAANGSVTLAAGEHKVCEITNNDEPATITLIKHVINDHGGTATVSDFPLFLSGNSVTSGVTHEVNAGSHVASEQNRSDYEAGSWTGDCAASGEVTLALGEHKVCEITNNDKPATITLIKHVINDDGGTASPGDFALFVDGLQVQTGVANEVSAGSYNVSEQNLPGYEAGSWTGDCSASGAVTLALGEHKVCEITNNDMKPPCDPTPTFAISNSGVDFNDPHNGFHDTTVSYDYTVDGEFQGEVQIFWRNGGSTFIKKRISVDLNCEDQAKSGRISWRSEGRSHHPGHGARYTARLVVNGQVVESFALN